MLLLALAGLVTVSFAPCPLPKALERLSEVTGRHLTCVPSLRNEVLLARLKGADEERVLREVAACLDAKWEAEGSELKLKPDLDVVRRRAVKARQAAISATKGALAQVATDLAKLPATFTKADAAAYHRRGEEVRAAQEKAVKAGVPPSELPEMTDTSPAWRAAARILAVLGSGTLLAMREGERTVWAEDPTPMQVAFPAGAQGVLGTYRREQRTFDPEMRITRVRFSVKAQGWGYYTAQIDGLGPTGEQADSAMIVLSDPNEDEPPSPATPKAASPEKPLILPEETVEYLTLLSSRQGAVRGETFDRWKARLSDPVAFEPTSWYPGAALLALAEAQNRNLVGRVLDTASARFSRILSGPTPAALMQEMSGYLSIEDGWLIARSDTETTRVSRADVSGFLAKSVTQGGLDVDTAAEWIGTHPNSWPSITWVGSHLGALLSGRGPTSALATLDEESVGLWYAFGPAVRAALRGGRTIPLVALPQAARRALTEKVYWGDAFETEEREITEALPNGIVNGTVSLEITEQPVAIAWSETKGEPVYRSPMTADILGAQFGRTQRRNVDLGYDRFRMGTTRGYKLRFEFRPERLSFTHGMNETFVNPNAKAIDGLPEEFKRRVETARQRVLQDPDEDPPVNHATPR